MKTKPDTAEIGYRWIIVATAAIAFAISQGQIVNGFSVFFFPLETEFGWQRGAVAMVNSVGLAGLSVGGIVMGTLADRIDIRKIFFGGALMLGVCVFLASRANELWQFYVLYFLAGAFGSGSLVAPLLALIGSWFVVGAGFAFGLAAAVQALGQGGVPFGTAFLIEAYGWRVALATQATITLVVLLPLGLLIKRPPGWKPAVAGDASDRSPIPLPPNVTLAFMSVAVVGCCICMAVPLMHLVPLIQDKSYGAPEAGSVLFTMLVVAIAGRVAFGKLADLIGPIQAWFAASLWQTLMVYFFVEIESLTGFYVYVAIYGFGYAGVMTGILVSTAKLTPASRTGSSMGIVMAFAFFGHGLGGYQGGLFYDLTGSYTVPFGNAALAGVFNLAVLATLFLTIRRRRLKIPVTAGLAS
jgi:MFS family permease